jgi:hypothetical protein
VHQKFEKIDAVVNTLPLTTRALKKGLQIANYLLVLEEFLEESLNNSLTSTFR